MASEPTDEQLARDLRNLTGPLNISQMELDAYLHQEGYSTVEPGFAINIRLGVSTRTIRRYAARVRYCVDRLRIELREGRLVYGCTVAQGSRTRHAGDPTAQGRKPTEESSWNEEALRVEGQVDRWSRKRR